MKKTFGDSSVSLIVAIIHSDGSSTYLTSFNLGYGYGYGFKVAHTVPGRGRGGSGATQAEPVPLNYVPYIDSAPTNVRFYLFSNFVQIWRLLLICFLFL